MAERLSDAVAIGTGRFGREIRRLAAGGRETGEALSGLDYAAVSIASDAWKHMPMMTPFSEHPYARPPRC